MVVERKENDLPKFTSNVVILEWGLVNTKYSNIMMPDFLVYPVVLDLTYGKPQQVFRVFQWAEQWN